MSKKINVAIVGLGFGAEFIPAVAEAPAHQLLRDLPTQQGKAQRRRRVFWRRGGVTRISHALLKDRNVDVVHINSPIPDHAWMSLAALKAGKHVACTVPMATSIADCRKIVDLAKRPASNT